MRQERNIHITQLPSCRTCSGIQKAVRPSYDARTRFWTPEQVGGDNGAIRRSLFPALLLLALLLCAPHPAHAVCPASGSIPTGVEGDTIYNSTAHVPQYCDNNNVWQAMGKINGAGGGGCSGPPTGVEGQMMYNQTYHVLQYCDGTKWKAVTNAATYNSGLVGWWKFDDGSSGTTPTTAADSSGGGSTGTLTNSPTWTTSGKSNDALTFANASNNYVDVANPAKFAFERTQAFSLAAWVYRTDATTESAIVGKMLLITTNWIGYSFWFLPNGSTTACNGASCTTNCLQMDLNDSAYNGVCVEVNGSAVTTNAWHLVTMTYDGSSAAAGIKIYVDGVAQTVSNSSTSSLTASILEATDLKIGVDVPGQGDSFTGRLNDVRVWNRALSASEVTALYNDSVGCTPVGLVGWWKFDEGTGTTTADSSGGGYTATLTGTPTWTTSGKIGNALTFNGTSQSATNASVPLASTPFALSFWMKTTSTAQGFIFEQGNYIYCQMTSSFKINCTDHNGGGGGTSTTTVNDGNWHLVTYVGTSTTDYIYIDGALQATTTETATTTGSGVCIGANGVAPTCSSIYFKGTLDDMRIYNRVLSASDVLALYNGISGGVEGQTMYNSTFHTFQYCDGTAWRAPR